MIASAPKNPQTLLEAVRHFTVDRADECVRSIRFPGGVCCPHCGSVNVGEIKSRRRFQCRDCRKQFSLITGTIMEGTHLKLDQWLVAIWLVVNAKNGISSCELARSLGIKQQSAWHLIHRIREIITQEAGEQMTGVVEVDETFVGGLFKHMSHERRERARMKGHKGKAVVHAIKERRSGMIRAEVIPAAQTEYVRDAILENVKPGSKVYTDESRIYQWVKDAYQHKSVNHADRYVIGTVHVNGCENFFNCLRRAVKGTYIKPTAEHLPAYVDEAVYRFNNRKMNDWERFDAACRRIVGKRLTYSNLTDGATR